jgi:uncharacterized protein (DUF4415 family)
MRKPMRPEMRPPMRPLTDEDGEVRELTAEDFKGMRPLREADPGLIEAVAEYRRKRGRPKSPAPKIYIGLRMAPDVVESLKASGPGYNNRVEQALRRAGFGDPNTNPARKAEDQDPMAKLATLLELLDHWEANKNLPARLNEIEEALLAKLAAKAALTREETDVLNALEAADRNLDPRVEQAMRKAGIRPAETKPAKKPAANKTPGRVYIEARPKGRQGSAIEDYVVEQGDRVLKTFKTQAEAITWAKSKGHSPHVARAQAAPRPAPAKSRA